MRNALGFRAESGNVRPQIWPAAVQVQNPPYPQPEPEVPLAVSTMESKTASGITEEVRKANQAFAAEKLADKAVIEPVKEVLAAAAGVPPTLPPAAQAAVDTVQEANHAADTATGIPATAPTVTLETLSTVEYSVLLAFCDAHPEVGVNTASCQAAFFRKLVEHKVKAFLETK